MCLGAQRAGAAFPRSTWEREQDCDAHKVHGATKIKNKVPLLLFFTFILYSAEANITSTYLSLLINFQAFS